MKFVPAEEHSAALVEWLRKLECFPTGVHVDRLLGIQPSLEKGPRQYNCLTPERQDAWMNEQRERNDRR